MALVRSESLAVGGIPGADYMVFTDGKDEIAFFGESARGGVSGVCWWLVRWPDLLDLGEGSLVAGE